LPVTAATGSVLVLGRALRPFSPGGRPLLATTRTDPFVSDWGV